MFGRQTQEALGEVGSCGFSVDKSFDEKNTLLSSPLGGVGGDYLGTLLPGRAWTDLYDDSLGDEFSTSFSYSLVNGVSRRVDLEQKEGGFVSLLGGHAYDEFALNSQMARHYLNAAILPATERSVNCALDSKQIVCGGTPGDSGTAQLCVLDDADAAFLSPYVCEPDGNVRSADLPFSHPIHFSIITRANCRSRA